MVTIEKLRHDALQVLRPPPSVPLSEWCEANITIPQTSSATPGKMRLWAFQQAIADAMTDPSINEIVIQKSARVGFSQLLMGFIAHQVATSPCPILVTQPTHDDARAFSVDTEALFEASPSLRGLISDGADDTGRSTLMRRLFAGGSLEFLSASSPRSFRRKLGKIAIADEIAAYEMSEEGSILDLLRMRTQTFRDRTLVFGGTPIFKGDAVCAMYEDSDQRIYEVQCCECQDFAEIQWKDLEFEKDDLDKGVNWICPNCGCVIPESRKAEMVDNGRWRATNPENKTRVGFKLNSLISPHWNARWQVIVAEFLKSKSDPAALQAWTNLLLGEGWEATGEGISESALTLVPASLDNIPEGALYLTGGCDVQADRLEISTVAWDAEGRGTVLAHEIVYGDPLQNDVWVALADLIARRFNHPRGGTITYDKVFVDAGDGVRAASIQSFCRGRAPQVFPSKGVSGWKQPPVALGKAADKTVRLQLLGVDGLKDRVHRMATAGTLQFSESLPPGYWAQLAGEEIRVRYSRGFAIREWHQITGRRSEGLDCAVMALAAKHLIHWNPDRRAEELSSAAAPKKAPAVIRSRWLSGG
ncbi:phage terminase large subunit family protein [Paenirhodobacter populi]|uniref:Phage terminase large subunit family protein n=1 Tax=Paenirhodobacter populi TaxID=2306993 RepID=A0A443IVF0_9RHOB|nr:terminase gpA endonuclease subunit [Sinirhodobacter populi]RWR12050.1 phage terminase large subunit family protein [Sinirhodobacter populi]